MYIDVMGSVWWNSGLVSEGAGGAVKLLNTVTVMQQEQRQISKLLERGRSGEKRGVSANRSKKKRKPCRDVRRN